MRLRPILANLVSSLLAIVIFFGVAETATRLFWHGRVEPTHVGVVLDGAGRKVVHEGIEYRTNSLGLRMESDVAPTKPAGSRRILALGDSFVWGDGLPYRDLVTVKLEERLRSDSIRAEVINGGKAGLNTHDELQVLLKLAPVCEPDLVIVFFFTNDVLSQTGGVGPAPHEDASWRQRAKEFLRGKSRFFAYLYYLYKSRFSNVIGVPKVLLPPDYFNLDDSKPGWVAFQKDVLDIQSNCRRQARWRRARGRRRRPGGR